MIHVLNPASEKSKLAFNYVFIEDFLLLTIVEICKHTMSVELNISVAAFQLISAHFDNPYLI